MKPIFTKIIALKATQFHHTIRPKKAAHETPFEFNTMYLGIISLQSWSLPRHCDTRFIPL